MSIDFLHCFFLPKKDLLPSGFWGKRKNQNLPTDLPDPPASSHSFMLPPVSDDENPSVVYSNTDGSDSSECCLAFKMSSWQRYTKVLHWLKGWQMDSFQIPKGLNNLMFLSVGPLQVYNRNCGKMLRHETSWDIMKTSDSVWRIVGFVHSNSG